MGKNEEVKKPVISSITVSGAKLHVSAIYQSIWHHLKYCDIRMMCLQFLQSCDNGKLSQVSADFKFW